MQNKIVVPETVIISIARNVSSVVHDIPDRKLTIKNIVRTLAEHDDQTIQLISTPTLVEELARRMPSRIRGGHGVMHGHVLKRAVELRTQSFSWREIGRFLGVDHSAVRKAILKSCHNIDPNILGENNEEQVEHEED